MTEHSGPQDEEDRASQISASRGSSLHGPYRQAKADNTFPRCHFARSIMGAEETYSRSLLSAGNGFAFWDITGSHIRGPTRLEQFEGMSIMGMSIGDVGIVDPNGQFVFGFNIFTAASDPLHQGRIPEDFEEVHPPLDRATEVKTTSDYFKPGTIIASKGVNVTKTSEEPLKASLWSTAREGAVLVLPHGGSREDLISNSRLTDYINKHAVDWYNYMCHHSNTSAATVPNGSLYLITGCDKAMSWCALSFPSKWQDAGKRIDMTYEGEDYPCWRPSRWANEKYMGLSEGKGRHFCVFGRGIRISLSNRLWLRHLPAPLPEESPYYNILSTAIFGLRSRIARIRERFQRTSGVFLAGREKFPFHPSFLISQVLLEQHQAADIALVDDSVWCNLAVGGHGTLSEVLDMIVNVVMSCEHVVENGHVRLVPKLPAAPSSAKSGFLTGLLARYAGWRARKRVLREVQRILKSK